MSQTWPLPPASLTLREIAWGALFIALGLSVPVLFHAVGLGPAFLPMFLPLLAAGLVLRPLPAALAGAITPPLSALLTGMPPMPIALIMAAEGLALAGVAALLYGRLQWNIYLAALLAVLAERLVMFALFLALAPLFGLPGRLAAFGKLAQGLPGLFLLILVVPLLVQRVAGKLERYRE
jgi:hypothetical protein